jgi:hypothetical protein
MMNTKLKQFSAFDVNGGKFRVTWNRVAFFFLILALFGSEIYAEETSLKELNQQVMALYEQGRYAEAIPLCSS